MIPVLYSPTSSEFITKTNDPSYNYSQGLGTLRDCISCYVTEEVNGEYELQLKYPITGSHFNDISDRCIILAKPSPNEQPQPFRIYDINTKLDSKITVKARHISYDLGGYVVEPFSSTSLPFALIDLMGHAYPTGFPFIFSTDKSVETPFSQKTPISARAILGGQENSLLDIYGGEYHFDLYKVELKNHRGMNRGMTIQYGKNMTDYDQDRNIENVYTAVYPYYYAEEELDDGSKITTLVTLSDKIVHCEGSFDHERVLTKDFTDEFDETPTEDQLRARTLRYISENDVGVPDVSWDLDFVQLASTKDYAQFALLERVDLGDTVNIFYEKIGVNASAEVIKYKYDVLADRYESVQLGKVKSSLAERVAVAEKQMEQKASVTLAEEIANKIAKNVTGANGGAVRIEDTNNDGLPDTIFIMDNPDKNLAQKVWRFNYEGWAASSDGFAGTYTMGATLNDGLLANFVTAANLTAGTISSQDGSSFYLNLDTGEFRAGASQISVNGQPLGQTIDSLETNAQNAINAIRAISDYISYEGGVLTLGDINSNVKLTLENDGLKFVNAQSGDTIAYFTNDKLHTYDGIDVGNNWEITTNYGFSIRWTGDVS